MSAAPMAATKGAAIASAVAPAAYIAGMATPVKAVPNATIAICASGGMQFKIAALIPLSCKTAANYSAIRLWS